MAILSIQSHVTYGYVGNKAAVFPLQAMGFDVWPVNTVQFSNHTGYGTWKGEIFSASHILSIIQGLEDIGADRSCRAILTGYMGTREICETTAHIAQRFKEKNPDLVYLCDPVIGNTNCFVKPEVLDYFKEHLQADIITPNQFEAETLSGISISSSSTLMETANHFHKKGTRIVVITGLKLPEHPDGLCIFISDKDIGAAYLKTQELSFPVPVNGTGDLFSAVFLGCYLKHKDSMLAIRQTASFMEHVLQATLKNGERELQVLSESYDISTLQKMPELHKIAR